MRRPEPAPRARGITLIELAIVVAILGILAAIVYPAYMDRTMRAKRMDAKTALLSVAAEQERFFLKNNQFATDLADIGMTKTVNEFYDLDLTADATTFTATAEPNGPAGSGQRLDDDCQEFAIDHVGRKTATSGTGADSSAKCWR